MINNIYPLLCSVIALCLCYLTFAVERASGAIPEPAIILIGDSGTKNYDKLCNEAAGAYVSVLGKCGIDKSALPYRVCDFKDGEVKKLFEKPFSVKSQDLPFLALVQQKDGVPARLIIRINNAKNLPLSFFKIMKIFKGEPLPSKIKKEIAEIQCEKDNSTMILIPRGTFFMGSYYGQGQKDE